MESPNLHHQQQQHEQQQVQVVGSSSSSPHPLPTRIGASPYNNSYGASGNIHAWSTRNLILNSSGLVPNLNGGSVFNPREVSRGNDDFVPQDDVSMGFPWGGGNAGVKEELSISSADSDHSLNADLSEKLLLKTISASSFHHLNAQDLYSNPNFGSFSHIYPSVNVPNLSQPGPASALSTDMSLQALDLLTSARFSDQQPSCGLEMIKDSLVGLDHNHHHNHHHRQMQEYRSPYCSPSRVLQRSAATESKRGNNSAEPSHTPKKSKLDSRASCPPLKVRKEKLGDRIAALQQLVAPFGKTDTASVLMEAIGYIQFLQNQVKTLSVPYMKSRRAVQGGSNEEGNEETRRNLRSRGLCLVPLSCMSYVAHMDSGGCEEVWPPPPNFGGGGGGATLR